MDIIKCINTDNEQKYQKMAKALGINEVFCLQNNNTFEKIVECTPNSAKKFKEKKLYRAEREDFLKNYKLILKNFDFICDLELIENYDYFNQFRSGANEMIMRDFHEHNITVIVDIKNFERYSHRIQQNFNLAKKFGVKFEICSFAENEYELLHEKDKWGALEF